MSKTDVVIEVLLDEDEDSHGLCTNYLGDVLFVPKGE